MTENIQQFPLHAKHEHRAVPPAQRGAIPGMLVGAKLSLVILYGIYASRQIKR
jgi:hypothetical protein